MWSEMTWMKLRALPFLALLVIPISIGGGGEHRYLYAVVYRIENRGSHPVRLSEDDRSIALFWSSRYQRVELLNSTPDIERRYSDDDGNPLALLKLPEEIGPGENLTLTIYYIIRLRERPRPRLNPEKAGELGDIPKKLVEEFCVSTDTFRINGEIRRLAEEITKNESTVLGMVTALVGWMRGHICYGSGELPKYPQETLRDGYGDCDDQAILLVTLCRAVGIPALLQLGCVYLRDYEGRRLAWESHLDVSQRNIGWHGWALVYIPPWGWLPVDLTLRAVGEPINCIAKAPEYEGYIAVCYNISRGDYVGDSRRERERVIEEELYLTLYEELIPQRAGRAMGIGEAIIVAATITIVIILILRWRRAF